MKDVTEQEGLRGGIKAFEASNKDYDEDDNTIFPGYRQLVAFDYESINWNTLATLVECMGGYVTDPSIFAIADQPDSQTLFLLMKEEASGEER